MGDEKRNIKLCGGACCCGTFLVLLIVILNGLKKLDQLDYGLNYNTLSLQIEDKVYTQSGLYYLGPAHEFITYPKYIQTIEFTATPTSTSSEEDLVNGDLINSQSVLQTRTSDGLPVSLSVSFQYRYEETKLRELYLTFEKQGLEVYENTAKAVIANVAVGFTAYQFFNDKQFIARQMEVALAREFREELFANVDAFQITRVELPSQFQTAILESIQAKQNITSTLRYKENMEVTFQQQILVANQTRLQTIALALGTAAQRAEQADANVRVAELETDAEMESYGNVSERVGLNTSNALDYIWWSSQLDGDATSKQYLVGVDPALLQRA